MKMMDLPRVDRPREKLQKYGPERLTNSELLATLLGTGTKGVNVIELSTKILKKYSGADLPKATVKELQDTFGLGVAKACEIVACFELGRRLLQDKKAELILSPKDVWEMLVDLRALKKEHFVVLYLDSRNQAIQRELVSVGTLNASLVHPREVFEAAIEHHAAQVIVAHNHPSGDTEPSEEDKVVTKRLFEAGQLLGIELLDHIIIANRRWTSMKEHGLLS
ncbi:MAG: hypothetical protein A3A33_01255 [Candidatus Yanofskybacteria bacterium RIFCSPLOWO2_01_FULL_49_25]|uniref:MPN domain-containing protein n=1 Tax=Candidatus Yanofskybacteria bacterium RIFCSPLOWO2_01_FULL_49_25 TaxID=1802701 RepID=A0A1F8GX14_9BACT|nr:MAG: hypothetical protein A3A33_01255 [Candidatus Yanofskybacteria bacterium RIFCSPLOWO2_01_FULL_49_25]